MAVIHRQQSPVVLRSGGDRPGDHHREWQPGVSQRRRSVAAALLDGQRMESAMAQAFADLLDRRR